ncbi:alcohol dehydrogenase catalytic domain-containing protein [Roseomonas sp. GC11]|uniref:zinc-dependent alcohol dehydrogenase n=1 Tax=Roseomonas sp. GC11 TaxID=2950546 RepID=UPI00210A5CE4|nr:alcohol dehydrogenase catalytic domain-containing protein [Roseomonas sp. GC11]MCQ4160338.1 alcohol dehydrogenase catalytic domain-containing protein [Roseomonas sp. GC11]
MTMLALRKTAPRPGLDFAELPEPVAQPGEVLVAVEAAGICGTDVHIAEWTAGYESMTAGMPVTIGHEFAGRIVALGEGALGVAMGQRVTVRPSTVCGRCAACTAGHPDGCTGRSGIGIGRDGAFAALVRVPALNCVAVPEGLDAELAAMTEPLSVSLHAVDLAEVRPGQRVLVLGPGPIGLGIALFAEAAGAEVVLAGVGDAARLATARAVCGATAIDLAGTDLPAALAAAGQSAPFDAVIEAAGATPAIEAGLLRLRKGGRLVVAGIHARPAPIDLTRLVRMEQSIHGAYRAPIADWSRVLAFMLRNTEKVRAMVTHRLPLAEAMRGFALSQSREAAKVILRP